MSGSDNVSTKPTATDSLPTCLEGKTTKTCLRLWDWLAAVGAVAWKYDETHSGPAKNLSR